MHTEVTRNTMAYPTVPSFNLLGRVGLTLGVFAILMPTAFQSGIGGLLLIWFLSSSSWRELRKKRAREFSWSVYEPVFFVMLKWIFVAACVQLVLLFVNEFGSSGFTERLRLMGKQGVYGLVVMSIYALAKERKFKLADVSLAILSLVLILTVYNAFQRYTGIDWVHGFGTKLGDNRFAYGVYRVSGFMSHPLTFAYNTVIFYTLCLTLGFSSMPGSRERYVWFACAALALVNLFLSSSRWPLFVGLIVSCIFFIRNTRLSRTRLLTGSIGLMMLLGLALVASPQVMGRFSEIFSAEGALYERMPRLAFWKVHLAMFLDHPLFGVGLTDIKAITADYYQAAGFASLERKYAAHNIYLQTLADSGIVGLVGLVALLTGSFLAGRLIVRSAKANGKAYQAQLGYGWQVLVIAVVLAGLMQNNLRDSEHVMALWLAMAAILTRMPAKIKLQPKARD